MYQGRQAVREGFESYLAGLVRNIEFGESADKKKEAIEALMGVGMNPLYQRGISYVIDLLKVQPEGFESMVILELQKISSLHVGDLERAAAIQGRIDEPQFDASAALSRHYSDLEKYSLRKPIMKSDYHRPNTAFVKMKPILAQLLRMPRSPN